MAIYEDRTNDGLPEGGLRKHDKGDAVSIHRVFPRHGAFELHRAIQRVSVNTAGARDSIRACVVKHNHQREILKR